MGKIEQHGLRYTVRDNTGVVVARCKYAEDAAAMMAVCGDGATVRVDNLVVWTEGMEASPAAESYDDAGAIMMYRRDTQGDA